MLLNFSIQIIQLHKQKLPKATQNSRNIHISR